MGLHLLGRSAYNISVVHQSEHLHVSTSKSQAHLVAGQVLEQNRTHKESSMAWQALQPVMDIALAVMRSSVYV